MQQAYKDGRLLVPNGPGPGALVTNEQPLYMVEVMPDASRRVTLQKGNALVCHRMPLGRIAALQARLGVDAPPGLLSEILALL